MRFDEPIDAFFGDFADDGTVDARPVTGLYSQNAATSEMGAMSVQHDGPSLLVAASSVSQADRGKTVVLPQGTFTCRRVEPMDDGLALLLLEAT